MSSVLGNIFSFWDNSVNSNQAIHVSNLFDCHPVSCIELLITGYLFEISDIIPPTDIVFLIAKYFIQIPDLIPNLFYITDVKASSFVNIATNKVFHCSSIPTNISNIEKRKNLTCITNCLIEESSLPYNCFKQLNMQHIKNANWSMIAHIGGNQMRYSENNEMEYCSLTAVHSSSFLNTKSDLETFDFKLPSISETISNAAVVYSKIHNKLYVLNGQRNHFNDHTGRAIFSLDMNSDIKRDNTSWKWEIESHNLMCMRKRTSACLVDNDRFIGILGGVSHLASLMSNSSKDVELYSFSCDKSIWLKDMNANKLDAASIYSKQLHKIIVIGHDLQLSRELELESYDINKDIWTLYSCNVSGRIQPKLYISSLNPNVIFFSTLLRRNSVPIVGRIDLRRKRNNLDIFHMNRGASSSHDVYLSAMLLRLNCH